MALVNWVLVQGAPGVGKTVMAGELCKQWAEGNLLQEYSLLVLLTLRDEHLQNATKVAELFDHPAEHISSAVVEFVSSNNGENTAFLLDGFDELPKEIQESKKSIFVQLIRKKYLPKACVIITSRPSASDIIFEYRPLNYQHVEVLGFEDKEINNFLNEWFDENVVESSREHERRQFESYLRSYPHIRALMYIPLNCHIIIEVYQSCKASVDTDVPTTQTQLYELHTRTILSRHLNLRVILKMKNIPKKVEENLNKLSELAYNCIVKKPQRLIFKEEEIPQGLQGSDVMGFMYVRKDRYLSASYNFLHLTIQEFLAAFYISTRPPLQQIQIIGDSVGKRHLEIMLRFFAGLTKFHSQQSSDETPAGWLQTYYKSGSKLECLRWMFEAQDEELLRQVLGSGTQDLDLSSQTLSPFDCYILGYCIAKSDCQWKLQCKFGEEGIKMMLSGGGDGCLRNVQVINLSGSVLKAAGVKHLGN